MNKLIRIIGAITAIGLIVACDSQPAATAKGVASEHGEHGKHGAQESAPDSSQQTRTILFYRHPMNPEITSPVPMEDSMGMPYTPVYADEAGGVVAISPAVVQSLGVVTAPAEQGDIARLIDTVGYVTWNAALVHNIQPRVPGWVETVSVYSVGEPVHAGQQLFSYYAPELVTAQHDYLRALANGGKTMILASRERLLALGMAAREIKDVTQTRKAMRAVGFYAPFDGRVTGLEVRRGQYLTPATRAVTLAQLDSVWVEAEVFPQQMQWLALGQAVELQSASLPGKVLHGVLGYLAPVVDAVTRTRSARVTLSNPDHALLPGMYVDVRIQAQAIENAVHIPLSALIRTGQQARVVLALGEGRFMSRAVVPGVETDDRVVITQGLSAGERVVTSAQFLLDSEASLRQLNNRLDSAPAEHVHESADGYPEVTPQDEMPHETRRESTQ